MRERVVWLVRLEEGDSFEEKKKKADAVWKSVCDDCDSRFARVPFYDFADINKTLGTDDWAPMPRFLVVQEDKTRGVDEASEGGSCSNRAASITEHHVTPTLDLNMATIRFLSVACNTNDLGALVIDGSSTHRQIPVRARSPPLLHRCSIQP